MLSPVRKQWEERRSRGWPGPRMGKRETREAGEGGRGGGDSGDGHGYDRYGGRKEGTRKEIWAGSKNKSSGGPRLRFRFPTADEVDFDQMS